MPDKLASVCKQCPPGFYCVGEHLVPEPCPPGFYCPGGIGYNWAPCPPGTFNAKSGLHNESCNFPIVHTLVLVKNIKVDLCVANFGSLRTVL